MAKPTRQRPRHRPHQDRRSQPRRPEAEAGVRRAAPAPLARPATLRWLWGIFLGALVLVVLANFVIHKQGHFGIDGSFAFFAWFGFLACIGVIVVAKVLGVFLRREEGYYRHGLDLGNDQPPDNAQAGRPVDKTP